MTEEIKLSYDERNAITVVRMMLKRNPAKAKFIMDGMAKEVAISVLLQAQKELANLLKVSQAISAAAGEIAKLEKKEGQV